MTCKLHENLHLHRPRHGQPFLTKGCYLSDVCGIHDANPARCLTAAAHPVPPRVSPTESRLTLVAERGSRCRDLRRETYTHNANHNQFERLTLGR